MCNFLVIVGVSIIASRTFLDERLAERGAFVFMNQNELIGAYLM